MNNILLMGLCSLSLTFCASACKFHPSLWCSSEEIATQCKVREQCSQFITTHQTVAPPVKFSLYYESLCPACRAFIKEQLWPTYKNLHTIMDLQLVPYGNAKESKDSSGWKFQCQHGEEECIGNVIETCSIFILKNISVYFPFIHCIEVSHLLPSQSAAQCAQQFGINYNPIKMCADGTLGNQLEHMMAVRTGALQPPHKYVPWVTLNGAHNDQIQQEAQEDLLKLICNAYQGVKPSSCTPPAVKKCDRF